MGVLRILLALSVVVLHSKPMLGSRLVGEVAVNSFFIVSGFYMTLILRGKYGSDLKLFFTNRALRLYPTYFAILAFVLISDGLRWFVRGQPSGSLALWAHDLSALKFTTIVLLAISNLTFFGADALSCYGISPVHGGFFYQGFSAGPSAQDFQIIRQTWSLGTEVIFYLFAPWLTRLSVWILGGIVLLAMVLRYFHLGGLSAQPHTWWEAFFLCRLPFFLLGAIAFHWNRIVYARKWTGKWSGESAVVLILLLTLLYSPLNFNGGIYYLSIVVLGPFLFHFSNCHPWDRLVGDFSYSIYLLHWIVLQYTWQFIRLVPAWSFSFLSSLVVIAGSALIWIAIEKPIDRYRQRRVIRRSAEKQTPESAGATV